MLHTYLSGTPLLNVFTTILKYNNESKPHIFLLTWYAVGLLWLLVVHFNMNVMLNYIKIMFKVKKRKCPKKLIQTFFNFILQKQFYIIKLMLSK